MRYKAISTLFFIALLLVLGTAATMAATLNVPSTSYPTIQSAVNAANPGDTIVLQAGTTFSEEVVLKYKSGSSYITIQSSQIANLPADGIRVSPSDAQYMAKIVVPTSADSAIKTEITTNGPAHNYRIIGVEFAPTNSSQLVYNLVQLGSSDTDQNSLTKVAHDFDIQRCYFHGATDSELRRGIALNSSNTSIVDSYFSEIHQTGSDAQAIAGWNGPGPYTIRNNYLEASGENILFGGSDPKIANLIPSDIAISHNYFSKKLSWYPRSPSWSIKNLFELKNAKRVNVTENYFENNWAQSQNGFALLITVRNQDGTAPWSTVEDVTFTRNVLKDTPRAFNILGQDSTGSTTTSDNAKNISITNNLLVSISTLQASDGKCFQIPNVPSSSIGVQNLTIEHNTCIGLGSYPYFIAGDSSTSVAGFTIRNNIGMGVTTNTDASIAGNDQFGTTALNLMSGSNWALQKNVLMLPNGSSNYPNSGTNLNYYVNGPSSVGFVDFANGNYALSSSSTYHNAATDGTDIGADIPLLNSKTSCIQSGNWSTCGGTIQSPYPSTAPTIPATVEAENFDRGGAEIAYHEVFGTTGSSVYRSSPVESVSIQSSANASNGYAVFEAAAGEWMEYSVNVPTTGLYNFKVRYASGYSQQYSHGKFRIEACEGTSAGGVTNCVSSATVTLNATGGWGTFNSTTVPLYLPVSGSRVLRLIMVTNAPGDTSCNCVVGNFDSISIAKSKGMFDYDNDQKSDVSVYRPSNGNWYLNQSTAGLVTLGLGNSTDIITPGDFDGDGKTDVAIYRPSLGQWQIYNSSTSTTTTVNFGLSGDIPVQADYDGDGKADIAVWRPSDGYWYILNSSNSNVTYYQFGQSGDRPAVGDYDGDGKNDYAVFRPSTGVWYLQMSSYGFFGAQFGMSTDKIVPGDFDGDGRTEMAIWRTTSPNNGMWATYNVTNGSETYYTFGGTGDVPVPADYDGDGKTDYAIFRPSDNTWYMQRSTLGYGTFTFGASTDIPTPTTYVR